MKPRLVTGRSRECLAHQNTAARQLSDSGAENVSLFWLVD